MRQGIRVALLLAANVLVLFGTLELALRVQEPFLHLMSWGYYQSPNYRFAVIDHPIWDHQLRPGLDVELALRPPVPEEGFRFRLRTNSWGCRYGEFELPRPAHHFRVIVLGDSFTEGYREEETVASQLERELDARGLPVDFEVVNCAVSSYSLLPILLRLREQLLAAAPDAVIVNVDLTDLHDDYWRRRLDLHSDAQGRPLAVGRPDAGSSRLRDFVDTHSYAARALRAYGRLFNRYVKHLLRGDERSDAARPELTTLSDQYRLHTHAPDAVADFEQGFRYFALQLDRILALCQQAGIACAFSTYPHREQLPSGDALPLLHREFAKRIAAQLASRGVLFFDAYDAIAAAYARDPHIYFTRDMHFRPAGQRAWGHAFADALAPWLITAAERAGGSR